MCIMSSQPPPQPVLEQKVVAEDDLVAAGDPPASAAPPQSLQAPGAPADNFNKANQQSNYPSRRVTIGHSTGAGGTAPAMPPGSNSVSMNQAPNHLNLNNPINAMGPGMMDNRRESMGSGFGNMDDIFGRRPSLGFDMGMDNFFGRRDSMDSTTAALDAAIMDLSRRRYSAAMGGAGAIPNAADLGGLGSLGFGSTGMMTSAGPPGGPAHDSITQRQQQLQQQQRELEHRQKELEFQRQQLIASMQERSYGPGVGGGGGGSILHRGSLGFNGSLGLGSVQSQGSGSLATSQMQQSQHMATHRSSAASGGSGQHWWICQVCNSKAFASHEEAVTHEAICQEGRGGGFMTKMDPMHPLPMHPQDTGMGRHFSLGLGMDSSQRGMSMGMGGMGVGMDNSTRGVVSMGMDSSRGGSLGYDSSRHMSLGMDSSSGHHSYQNERTMSLGPFAMLSQPIPLAMPSDKDWLTPLHCFVRGHCVEVFTATEADVATPSKGKRKPIHVGQIGIRCPHCRLYDSSNGANKARERGSVYYPTTISSIYNATMNLLQRHLHNCPAVPDEIMRRYETLKADDARSGTSKRYWMESALSLGLVDTPNGIRHSALRPPPLPTLTRQQETTGQDVARRSSNEFFGTKSNALPEVNDAPGTDTGDAGGEGITNDDSIARAERDMANTAPLVTMDDKPYATTFSFHLMGQMQPCVFTEADRLGKRKGLPPGFPGLACRHCFGGYGSGRFFPSSIKTLSDTSKTLNVLHNHMMRCRKCPADVKENLEKLRGAHDEERAKMKFGSQKAFFGRIWERLHGKNNSGSHKHLITSPNSRRGLQKRAMGQPPQLHHQGYAGPQMHGLDHQQHASGPSTIGGLEALAAASSPSKRQKI